VGGLGLLMTSESTAIVSYATFDLLCI
jgi:hypothetical protein